MSLTTSLNKTSFCNIPEKIENKLSIKLHNQKNHPIEIIKRKIYDYFSGSIHHKFDIFDNLNPVVSIEDNFDGLLIPHDHPARSKSDTYYVNEKEVLRTHTSAHQNELLRAGNLNFLITGDVYRKDEIDSRHYPVFHQMEIFAVVDDSADPIKELQSMLSGLVEYLFPNCEYRFNPDYFPFTEPSYEMEVKYNENWLEILGCGIVQPEILHRNNINGKKAIAAGLGLDRLAMIFCQIPDIRLLWCTHERFLNQFQEGKLVKFIPFSELESQYRDISFFIPKEKLDMNSDKIKWLEENDFFELVREYADSIMEEVKLIDSFYNQKKDKYSRTYRMTYSPTDPDMKNGTDFFLLINSQQKKIIEVVTENLHIEIR